MAVKPTPNNSLYKGFTFDGIDSRDYGVYISGDAVFDSPERDVEMIEIPGRNGSFALDKGRFGNITVSYPAGLFGEDEASFREGIRALRNALASRKGYCRLEDDYNPNEYRMAVYKKGLEVDPALLKAGEFTIEFDCMPQRWLKSGETAVSVASGGTLTNPTLFESHPLLQVWGYGDIVINDDTITIADDVIGDVILKEFTSFVQGDTNSKSWSTQLDVSSLRDGDTVTMVNCFSGFQRGSGIRISYAEITQVSGEAFEIQGINVNLGRFFIRIPELTFTANHSSSYNSRWRCKLTLVDNTTATYTVAIAVSYSSTNRITIQQTVTPQTQGEVVYSVNAGFDRVTAYSTKSALGEPLLFDLDIGEAYKEEDGSIVSVNNAVSFPARLPVLKSGTNTITYENTVDQFKIVPRWWEV